MSLRTLRPRFPPFHLARTTPPRPSLNRPLSSTPITNTEQISATRTLPYPALTVYDIITDIPSYPSYIPFCTSATITSTSNPDTHYARTWPQKATLTVGYGEQFNETFTSAVYCVPPIPEAGRAGVGIVEAVSGSARQNLKQEQIAHHTLSSADVPSDGPLSYLKSRWTVREFPFKPAPLDGTPAQEGKVQDGSGPKAEKRTDVHLSLEFTFRNPVYEMMSAAVKGKIAEKMIEAFVKRVENVVKETPGESAGTKINGTN